MVNNLMVNLVEHPATSLTGIGSIITGVHSIISGDLVGGITAIFSGIILMIAKDPNLIGKDDEKLY